MEEEYKIIRVKDLYYRIIEEIIKDIGIHDNLLDSIDNARKNEMDKVHTFYNEGKIHNEQLYILNNSFYLEEKDDSLEKTLPNYKFEQFVGVLQN